MKSARFFAFLTFLIGILLGFIAFIVFALNVDPTLYPTSSHMISLLFIFSIFGGVLSSLVIGALLYFWRSFKEQIKCAKKAQNAVEADREAIRNTREASRIGTWKWDLETDKIILDEIAARALGEKTGLTTTISHYIQHVHPEDREKLQQKLKERIESKENIHFNFRMLGVTEEVSHLTFWGRVVCDIERKPVAVDAMVWDITATSLHLIRLTALVEITTLFNQELSLNKAMQGMLRILNKALGWEIISIWRLNNDTGLFECLEVIENSMGQFPQFSASLKKLKIENTERTLASQVLRSNKPACSNDFGKEAYFISSEAAKEGIRGAVAYPLFEKEKLSGIIENFSSLRLRSAELNQEEIDFFSVIGTVIGQFLQRMDSYKINARLSAIVTSSKSAIYSIDLEGYIISWNPAAEVVYGWAANEIIGKSSAILYPRERLGEFSERFQKFKSGRSTQNYETQRIRKDFTLIWVDVIYSMMKDEKGLDFGVSVIAQDITAQKELSIKLKKSEEKFRSFVETTQDWVWETDATFKYVYASPSVEKILGFAPHEIIGKEMFFFLAEEDREKVKKEMQACIMEKRNWMGRVNSWLHSNHSTRFLESNGSIMLDEKGVVIGFRGTERDITERIHTEQARREFLSIISHELKTPLTSIHGALNLLIAGKERTAEKTKELLSLSLRNAERLERLIAETLDLEKIRLGKLELHPQPVSLAETIHEAIRVSSPMAESSRVVLEEGTMLPEIKVNGDPERIVQVLLNLLSNAIKFSPSEGKVIVSMEKIGEQVRVKVTDQGKGIPEEFKSKIFSQFSQGNNQTERAAGGTGLGLNICKGIIEQMKGNISFISAKGQETTFYFELPELK